MCRIVLIAILCSCENNKKANKDIIIESLIDSLNVYKEHRNGERMLDILDSLEYLKVNMSNVVLLYADAYTYSGNLDKAIQILKDSIVVSSKPQLLYNELGSIYLLKKDTVDAIMSYKQAINCNPNYARPYISFSRII